MATADSSQILYVSPAFEQVFGIPCETLYRSPQAWLDSVHPDDRSAASILQRPTTTTPYDNTYRICRADGELRWVHVRSFPLCNGLVRLTALWACQPISPSAARRSCRCKENEELFRGIFEQSAMGIIEADMTSALCGSTKFSATWWATPRPTC
jgi:PAS domain S-box-containing protein